MKLGVWQSAVERARRKERRARWARIARVVFSVVAIAATLALYFYRPREAWRHRPGQRPNSSNEAVRFATALRASRGSSDQHDGRVDSAIGHDLRTSGERLKGTGNWTIRQKKTGGGRAGSRNSRTATDTRDRAW